MPADYSEERLYVLEGRILALQAIVGVFLNEVAPTNDARRHARDVISHIMDAVDFSDYLVARSRHSVGCGAMWGDK